MFKKTLIFILLYLFMCYITIYADIANDITTNCSITSSKSISNLLDDRYSTSVNLYENDYIDIKSNISINAIYILWDVLPYNWSVSNKSNDCNIYNFNSEDDIFLHQLIKLEGDIKNIRLNLDKGDSKIAEIYVFNSENLPNWVQDWNSPYKKADMLLIPTHADDEHLFFGGTMPYYAGEKKLKVQVAYLTNHYNFRVHELLNGLWAVGIKAYPIISDFSDYYAESLEEAKNIYNEDKILEFQIELLRRFKPNVVIGHDLNGEYGHGVHMLNSHSLKNALELSKDRTKYTDSVKKHGIWNVQKCYLHLFDKNKISMNWDIPLKNFNGKTAFEMAIEGFSHHYSQQEYFSVSKKGVMNCQAFGLYHTIVGEDILKNDFFENIEFKKYNNKNKFFIER